MRHDTPNSAHRRSTSWYIADSAAARAGARYVPVPSVSVRTALVERLADDRPLRRARLVEPADRRRVRRVARDLRILGRLAQDLGDRVGERVERLARLGLGRLDQQRL